MAAVTGMFDALKVKIDAELFAFLRRADKLTRLRDISPVLSRAICEFVSRDGKRVRPIMLSVGYLGYAARPAPGLFTSALSIELLHDFMLIHDDIIDKSDLRRGKPSMHLLLDRQLKKSPKVKFSGQDLAIVAGDVVYAMAIQAFLEIKVDMKYKEEGLRKFIEAALYTGAGEFIELLAGAEDISRVKLPEIYKIYDYKTAYYTFACPLAVGAILAGAPAQEVKRLNDYGICLGRAFQIKDDIIGMFSTDEETGKPGISDLQEAKKTVLMHYAFRLGTTQQRAFIHSVLSKKKVTTRDLAQTRRIIIDCGALECVKKEVVKLRSQAVELGESLKMRPRYRQALADYANLILEC
jgi:geranylgeranyl diphosphate synthase type I